MKQEEKEGLNAEIGRELKSLWHGFEVISSYSRAQAIADGVLIDITEVAARYGYKVAVAITSGAWADEIEPDQAAQRQGQDARGRLGDMLMFLHQAIKTNKEPGERMNFKGLASYAGIIKPYVLACVSGPGDTGQHVLTIMKTDED